MTRRIFALVGDTHADADNRFDEHNEVMNWIAWDAKGRGAQALLHSGDVYERTSNSREREAVARWVMTAAGLMPVVIVAGNHDDPRDIEALGHLNTKFRVYAETRPGPLLPVEAGSADAIAWIALLPWPQKAYLLAGAEQKSRAQGDVAAVTALRNILRDYGVRFAGLGGDEPRLFLGHCMMRGSRVGISQPPLVGADFELGVEDLGLVGADFYGLGHIHLGQDWVVENNQQHHLGHEPPIVYPGSPRRMNFGEIEEKSYVLLTFDDRQLVSWERVPTPCRRMIHLTGDVGEIDGQPHLLMDSNGEIPQGAEVRVRYEVPAEGRVAGRAAAARAKDRLMALGAVNVVLEEVVQVEQRARAPEVAAAATNRDRLWEHWRSKGIMLEGQGRVWQCLTKLEELEQRVAESSLAPKLGAIRFRQLAIQGFGPFDEERVVQLDQLEGKITAVTGANGAGKSTLLEALIGGVYRKLPTRGSLVDLATSRDACLQVHFDCGGHTYYAKQLVDGTSRKSESSLTRDTYPVVRSTKVTAVQEWVDRNLPSLELQLVSTFAAQKSGGFLDVKPAERKALLLKVRGVEQLKELAALARARAVDENNECAKLEARLADRRPEADELEPRQAELAVVGAELTSHEEMLTQAKQSLANTEAANADARAVNERRDVYMIKRHGLTERRKHAEQSLARIQERQEALRQLSKRGAEIRAAAARVNEIERRLTELSVADKLDESAGLAHAGRRRRLEDAKAAAAERVTIRERALAQRGKVDQALVDRPLKEAALTSARAVEERERAELRELEQQHLANADDRITMLRRGLLAIRDGAERPLQVAGFTLDTDDAAVRLAKEVPTRITAKCGQLGAATREVRQLSDQLARLNELCAGQPLLLKAEQELETARVDVERLTGELEQCLAEVTRIAEARGARKAETDRLKPERAKLLPVAIEAPMLERAEVTLEELAPQQAQLNQTIRGLEDELSALGAEPPPGLVLPTAYHAQEVSRLEGSVRERTRLTERLRQRIEQMKVAAQAVAELTEQKAARFLDMSDWQRLALDLGNDGLQAALSDAALPELVALTNTLLHTAFGPRFTVDVRSQKADAAGKRLLETLDVVVIDTLHGREALAETYSGGELAIIGEALSLALTVLACRSSDGTPPTLVRDEAGAALDPANGRAWMAMLRRAVEMIGADRLLFVSHSPEIAALADSRIEL